MKSSLFLAAASALLASAGPLGKRAQVTDWVTIIDYVTVEVTENGVPEATPPPAVVVEAPKNTPIATPLPPPVETKVPEVKPSPQAPPPPPPPPSKPEVKVSIPPVSLIPVVKPSAPAPPPPPPPSPPPQAPASPSDDYGSSMLNQHNAHRRNHSSPDLAWDDTLAQYAANTAGSCVFAHDMNQGGGGYGQNLASAGSSGDISGLKLKSGLSGVTDQWYNGEVANYNAFYGLPNPPSSVPLGKFGHFTQLVWKSSTKVGCATVQCPAGTVLGLPSWYTVCNYSPPGNFGGQYGNNVLQPLGLSLSIV